MSSPPANDVHRSNTSASTKRQIRSYLCERSAIFRKLASVQDDGWANQSGDVYFQQQRQRADSADFMQAMRFFDMMQRIGDEMQERTDVLTLPKSGARILDLCMAPGGYTASALKYSPWASVSGATLAEQLGGHRLLVEEGYKDKNIEIFRGDITLLAADMGFSSRSNMPDHHADFGVFNRHEQWAGKTFDLVFCDGQVLRNHLRHMADTRRSREAIRLTCSQLVIAMRHVKVGGSMVVLLHRLDAWDTIATMEAFDAFAEIQVFKPSTAHTSRGSFYLVAKDIQPQREEAVRSVERWRKEWEEATFGSLGERTKDGVSEGEEETRRGEEVARMLDRFGGTLIRKAEPAWKMQSDALQKQSWFKKKEGAASMGSSPNA